ncbi:MAG: hypothetical protein ACYS4W_07705 [Planctomycetota bacterium]|jgi:hypothetical protein
MENGAALSDIYFDGTHQMPKISKLAVASVVFGVLGPFSAGAMWVASFTRFLTIGNPVAIGLFSCVAAWILGLIFGIESLALIDNSGGQLAGKEYATVGLTTSVVWMVLILACVLLPTIFYVNS